MLLGWRFEWRPALSALSSSLACESFWDCPISSRREPQDRHKKGISMHNDRIQSEHLFEYGSPVHTQGWCPKSRMALGNYGQEHT
jgi:hypothetical protein